MKPIDRFGVVAAMSKNHVIGVEGRLPWNIPAERRHFLDMTANQILILGRKTWQEETNQSHVSHAWKCIVISRTLKINHTESPDSKYLSAGSFPEALHMARELSEQRNVDVRDTKGDEDQLSCWVAGGEGIYGEALLHPAAQQLHLSVIDNVVEFPPDHAIARFPAKYRWENKFELKRKTHVAATDDGDQTDFTQYVYDRIRGRR